MYISFFTLLVGIIQTQKNAQNLEKFFVREMILK